MSLKENDVWLEGRHNWLEIFFKDESHILNDERGDYILVENEVGTPGEEGYSVSPQKYYLPEQYQSSHAE